VVVPDELRRVVIHRPVPVYFNPSFPAVREGPELGGHGLGDRHQDEDKRQGEDQLFDSITPENVLFHPITSI